jgi:hypothetical protein
LSFVAALLAVLFSYVFLIFNEKINILLLSIKSAQGVLPFSNRKENKSKGENSVGRSTPLHGT